MRDLGPVSLPSLRGDISLGSALFSPPLPGIAVINQYSVRRSLFFEYHENCAGFADILFSQVSPVASPCVPWFYGRRTHPFLVGQPLYHTVLRRADDGLHLHGLDTVSGETTG